MLSGLEHEGEVCKLGVVEVEGKDRQEKHKDLDEVVVEV